MLVNLQEALLHHRIVLLLCRASQSRPDVFTPPTARQNGILSICLYICVYSCAIISFSKRHWITFSVPSCEAPLVQRGSSLKDAVSSHLDCNQSSFTAADKVRIICAEIDSRLFYIE